MNESPLTRRERLRIGFGSAMLGSDEYTKYTQRKREEEARKLVEQARAGKASPNQAGAAAYGQAQDVSQQTADPAMGYKGGPLPPMDAFAPGTRYGETEAGKAYNATEQLGKANVADPQSVYQALVDAGMTAEAASYAQKIESSAQTATVDEIDGALQVLEQDPNIGPESTTYRLLKAVRTNPKLAATILSDASDINKSYSLIGRDVDRENELRAPKAQTAAATTAASTGARIGTEADLAPVAANTAATQDAARTRAKAETERDLKKEIPGQYSSNQYQAAGFANRMKNSGDTVDELSRSGFNPAELKNAVMKPDALNLLKSPQQQKYAQAMRDFINASLRRESGAAISEKEFDSAYKQYFAQAGDSPEVLEQKRKNRISQFAMMRSEAAGAYDEVRANFEKELQGEGGGWIEVDGVRIREVR